MAKADNVGDISVDKLANHALPAGDTSQQSFIAGLVGDKCDVSLENLAS